MASRGERISPNRRAVSRRQSGPLLRRRVQTPWRAIPERCRLGRGRPGDGEVTCDGRFVRGYTLLYRRAQECPAQRDPIRGPLVGADDGALEIRDQLVDAGRAFRLRSGIRVDQAAHEGGALLLDLERRERQQI